MITLEQLRTQYRDQILALARKHGIENVRVFGSLVRGEQHEDSDVDFLCHLPADKGVTLWEMAGMWGDLEEILPVEFDLVADENLRPEIASRVLRDAVPL